MLPLLQSASIAVTHHKEQAGSCPIISEGRSNHSEHCSYSPTGDLVYPVFYSGLTCLGRVPKSR